MEENTNTHKVIGYFSPHEMIYESGSHQELERIFSIIHFVCFRFFDEQKPETEETAEFWINTEEALSLRYRELYEKNQHEHLFNA